MLNRLKRQLGVRSHDALIKKLLEEVTGTPKSMFGSNPELSPFTKRDEAESHEL